MLSRHSVAYLCMLSLALGKQLGDVVQEVACSVLACGSLHPAWHDFGADKVSMLLHEVGLSFSWWGLL